MPVPKRKTPRWKRDQRRANIKLRSTGTQSCSNCGAQKLPHHVCQACGFYDGVQVTGSKS